MKQGAIDTRCLDGLQTHRSSGCIAGLSSDRSSVLQEGGPDHVSFPATRSPCVQNPELIVHRRDADSSALHLPPPKPNRLSHGNCSGTQLDHCRLAGRRRCGTWRRLRTCLPHMRALGWRLGAPPWPKPCGDCYLRARLSPATLTRFSLTARRTPHRMPTPLPHSVWPRKRRTPSTFSSQAAWCS